MKRLTKSEVLQWIGEVGVIPIVRVDSADLARRAVAAIQKGGVTIVEITMTVPGAIRVIEELTNELGGETLIGAGTVLDPENAKDCIAAGAQFVVSPALNPKTIAYCKDEGVVVLPGALTPTEIVTAWNLGADMVKIFPAGEVGGAGYLKAVKAPLPHIKMVPTGGVSLSTAKSFLEAGADALGVGGDLVSVSALKQGKDAHITDRARQFVQIVKEFRGEAVSAESRRA
ncbi:MAG TPA: bifunctional 4-hydroxy-2-oxoglutarate aldolase/2-dehydro-3-deoxy-phosphogluconate aldolase [Candidatus Acidoferrales bacterium]|nr:bifunctional 4-hydroxy-2-oxoglutarate aldolase/2-dehydro-3-deoxy-phosphogluconate aldolase [Candidatus Acidoferrales bacterium]